MQFSPLTRDALVVVLISFAPARASVCRVPTIHVPRVHPNTRSNSPCHASHARATLSRSSSATKLEAHSTWGLFHSSFPNPAVTSNTDFVRAGSLSRSSSPAAHTTAAACRFQQVSAASRLRAPLTIKPLPSPALHHSHTLTHIRPHPQPPLLSLNHAHIFINQFAGTRPYLTTKA